MLKSRQDFIHYAIPSGTFLYHNDPKHTANASDSDKTLTQSPELNIIEAVWDHLDREINKGQPKSEEELWEVLKLAWYNIPEDYQRKLPKRVNDVQREVNTDFCL